MIMRRFTDFVLQSRLSAMATAFLLAFVPVISGISIVIAALVTLRKGVVDGLLVTLAATLPYVISYYTGPSVAAEQMTMAVGLFVIVILSNLLTWIFAIVLRQYSSWSVLLELVLLLGILIIGVVHLFFPDVQNWWSTQLGSSLTKAAATAGKLKAETDIQLQAMLAVTKYATGFVMGSVLFNVLLQLVLARWWQSVMFNPGGLRQELHQIRLSHISGIVFLVALALAYWGNDIALDAMPILFAAFFVAGLSLFHRLLSLAKNAWFWLILLYLGIIGIFPLSVIFVSFTALLDTWMDFRTRFKKA